MSNTDTDWTEQYMEAHPPQNEDVEIEVEGLARPAGWPFIQAGALHISPEHLSHWVRSQGDIKTGPTAAAKILKEQGGTPSGMSSPMGPNQVYRFWTMPQPEPPQGEGQDGQAEEQQGPKDKKCRRCGNVGQYCHGDGLLCVDCFDELAHILRSFQRVPCICGASASEPCRTKSGKVISKAHKTRLAALDELNRKEWEEKHR